MTALPQPIAPDIRVEYVTPQMAQAYLEHNLNNRTLSRWQVNKHAYAMSAGDWQLSDSIKFDTYGRLIDGQHRLAAIMQADVTVPMFVVRGLDPSAQDVIDTGRPRSAADAMQIHGYQNANILSASVKLLIAYESDWIATVGSRSYPRLITTPEILRYIDSHPKVIGAAKSADHDRRYIKIAPSALCFARYVFSRIDEVATHAFFKDLTEMRTTGEGDPRAALLRWLARREKRQNQPESVYLLFRTWNAVRSGEAMRKIMIPSQETKIPKPI